MQIRKYLKNCASLTIKSFIEFALILETYIKPYLNLNHTLNIPKYFKNRVNIFIKMNEYLFDIVWIIVGL